MSGAPVAQTSRFLTVPAEIRNRIYDLAVKDANAWQDETLENEREKGEEHYWDVLFAYRESMLPRLIPPRSCGYYDENTPNHAKDWNEFRRKYLGLSQACSQIRREFLPLYSAIWTGVNLSDLDKYLRDFVILRGSKLAECRGCIDVGVRDDVEIEIRDTLIMLNNAPFLELQFSIREKYTYWEIIPGINYDLERVLLHAKTDYPKFWTFMTEQTSSITFTSDCHTTFSDDEGVLKGIHSIEDACIYIKPDVAEDWMLETRYDDKSWLDRFDLPSHLLIFFEIDKHA